MSHDGRGYRKIVIGILRPSNPGSLIHCTRVSSVVAVRRTEVSGDANME